jgi:hypothetical protein
MAKCVLYIVNDDHAATLTEDTGQSSGPAIAHCGPTHRKQIALSRMGALLLPSRSAALLRAPGRRSRRRRPGHIKAVLVFHARLALPA